MGPLVVFGMQMGMLAAIGLIAFAVALFFWPAREALVRACSFAAGFGLGVFAAVLVSAPVNAGQTLEWYWPQIYLTWLSVGSVFGGALAARLAARRCFPSA